MASIREMRPEDAEETSKVLREAMLDFWERFEKDYYPKQALEFDLAHNSPEYLRERLTNPLNFAFIAEEEGIIIGIAFGDIVGASGLARLGWMGVHPSHQRRGIGKALLQRLLNTVGKGDATKSSYTSLQCWLPRLAFT